MEGLNYDEDVYITVKDVGEGISPENMQHVLNRFYRVEGDTAPRGSGGANNIESTSGQGCTVTLIFLGVNA
jgi:signal transduction histidine kinase